MDKRAEVIPSIKFYRDMYRRRSADELRTIARVKRYVERVAGDQSFRERLRGNPDRVLEIAREHGFDIDPNELTMARKDANSPEDVASALQERPMINLWHDWLADLITFRGLARDDGFSADASPKFNAWRRRQVARIKSEMGHANADAIVHPVACYELSKGCSVGCWFCGLSADRFQGYYPYAPEYARLWREVLKVSVEKFGTAAQTGFCYWATEPSDNPDYLWFVRDYQQVVGVVPQTTSAGPLKNVKWTRGLMKLQRTLPAAPSRFSVLNKQTLLSMHETFTPDELLGHELILHNKGSIVKKNLVGRALRSFEKAGPDNVLNINPDVTSIARVSGFLVNMMDRSVKLISPCRSSVERPLGYRVHLGGSFVHAHEYGEFIDRAIDTCMPYNVPPGDRVAFRKLLIYERVREGFKVNTPFLEHKFTGAPYVGELGDLIAEGSRTRSQIIRVVTRNGGDFFGAVGTLQDIFDRGLLEDEPLPADSPK